MNQFERGVTMDRLLTYPSIVLGLAFIYLYVRKCYKDEKKFHLPDMINIFLLGSGVFGGMILVVSSLVDSLRQYISDMNLYIAISGITVFAVSIQGLFHHGLIKSPYNESDDEDSSKEFVSEAITS